MCALIRIQGSTPVSFPVGSLCNGSRRTVNQAWSSTRWLNSCVGRSCKYQQIHNSWALASTFTDGPSTSFQLRYIFLPGELGLNSDTGVDLSDHLDKHRGDYFQQWPKVAGMVCVSSTFAESCDCYVYIRFDPCPTEIFIGDIQYFNPGILTLQPTFQPTTKAAGLERHQLVILFLGFPAFCMGILSIICKKWPYADDYVLSWHGVCLRKLFRSSS
jgi:hypothetical protein